MIWKIILLQKNNDDPIAMLIVISDIGRTLWNSAVKLNTLRLRQNDRPIADDIFKCIFWNKNIWILINISLKYVSKGPIDYIPALVQIMAWRRPGDKPLSEPMMVSLLMHMYVTGPQWGNDCSFIILEYKMILVIAICSKVNRSLRILWQKLTCDFFTSDISLYQVCLWASIYCLVRVSTLNHGMPLKTGQLQCMCSEYIPDFSPGPDDKMCGNLISTHLY